MCEIDEQCVPLNDGNNWKGDPNATLSGQSVPQLPRRLAGAPGAAARFTAGAFADTDEGSADVKPVVMQRRGGVRLVIYAGLITVLILGALGGWLGYQAYQTHRAQQQRDLFLQIGRRAAPNRRSIDYAEVDTDVQRIVDSGTGTFRDDFQKRAHAFVDGITHTQSQSQGTITEAGPESDDNNEAQVLVAVSVKTTIAGTPQRQPRAWRMRINVQRVGNDIKVSNVVFVP
jgi:Mce-associated membrane protein